MDTQEDPKTMSLKDWIMVESHGPTIREIKFLIGKNWLTRQKVNSKDPQVLKQYLHLQSHVVLKKGVLYQWVKPAKDDRNAL